ncbi:MAG TPA: DUF362 domain-containing protein [Candidatus Methylomirabilis sp.]|nr:DUF362 domain-containing protein [Candidatus Methylomirabilis sp.]
MTRVSIVRVEGRDRECVSAAVRQAVSLAGGLADLIRPGMRVMVKPNLVAPPASTEAGACTSPLVCQAVADLVRELGARPVIAESSARGADTEAAFRIMGYEALRQQGYEVVDLKKDRTVRVKLAAGRVLEEVTTFESVTRMDAIISVPVLKTHDQGGATLSLKNLKGLVTDAEKRRIHLEGMFEGAVDLASHFRPVFAVVDGLIGQEGMGPLMGLPVELGLVLAGRDLVAVDATTGRLMGFEADEVPITQAAAARGLGTADLMEIEVTGEALASVRRRFVRCEEDHRIDQEGVTIVHSEGTCTGCRNGLLSSLFDMRADGTLRRARGLTVVVGPTAIPQGIPQELLVGIGTCAPAEARRLPRFVRGCPPNNVDIVRALGEGPPSGMGSRDCASDALPGS